MHDSRCTAQSPRRGEAFLKGTQRKTYKRSDYGTHSKNRLKVIASSERMGVDQHGGADQCGAQAN